MQLSVTAVGFEVLARRVWALHRSWRPLDAAYVGMAAELGALLLTLSTRGSLAPGTTCTFLLLRTSGGALRYHFGIIPSWR